MAETRLNISKEDILEWVNLRYLDLANQLLVYHYYYVGEPVSIFDLLLTMSIEDLINSDLDNSCINCLISGNLNRYKGNYCQDSPLVTSCLT